VTTPEVFVVRDHGLLLEAAAARLLTHLVDRLAAAGQATLLIAPDPLITELLVAVSQGPVRHVIDWPAVSVWWSHGSWGQPEPVEQRKPEQLLELLGVLPERIHPVPVPLTERQEPPEELAASYADRLAAGRQAGDHGPAPSFDIALLEVAADGSVAGLHPERPTAHDERPVAVDRVTREVTVTGPTLRCAREVWLMATGREAAPGVHLGLSGAGPYQVPAVSARGAMRTLVLVDEAAASQLPQQLRRIASP